MRRSLILVVAVSLTALAVELALADGLRLRYARDLTEVPPGTSSDFVNCRPGEKVVGGGVATSGVQSELELGPTYPQGSTSWIGAINNQSGNQAFMSLHAVCADSGRYERVSKSTTVPAHTSEFEQVRCPAGTMVTGGGVQTSVAGANVELGATIPTDRGDPGRTPDDGWKGVLHNEGDSILTMTVHAICIENRAFFPSYSIHRVDVPAGQLATVRARCPLSANTGVSGGGVNLGGLSGDLELTDTYPVDFPADQDERRDDGWLGGANNESSVERTLSVVAICP